jgi:lipopolysaccharide export LptBFGC system permease protein LptF
MREYAAAIVVAAFFGFEFWRAPDPVARMGFLLLIAGIAYVVWELHTKASSEVLPEDAGLSSYIEFQRRELERQRDALRSVWRWYLGPLVPGMAVLLASFGRANPRHIQHIWLFLAIEAAVIGAVFAGIAKLNSKAADKLQKQIDDLDEGGR